ncbi:MAG: flagellar hook-basal body protein [Clostridiales bacterium]|nr:flagellar hook-basal body protein [Clostridiales bacterium]
MFEAILTAASGISGQQRRIDTIADNVANVNTAGFRASRLNFKDALYVAGRYAYADEAANQQKGHGLMTASISRVFSSGSFIATERNLDFAIEGEGFFEIMSADGSVFYTRAGNFYLSDIGGEQYLVNGSGNLVLDDEGAPIILPDWAAAVNIGYEGQLVFTNNVDRQMEAGFLALYDFINADGLSSLGGCNYVPTAASGEPMKAERCHVRQGVLENSNVDMGQEMTRLIRAQRAFSFASRALTTADDMEGIANNLRR